MKAWLAGLVLALLAVLSCTVAFAQIDDSAARQAYASGDYKAAKTEYFSLVAHDPNSGAAWLGLARSCIQLGEMEEALAAFERAQSLDELDAAAHTEYGDVLKQQGRLEEAIEQYKMALDSKPAATAGQPAKPPASPVRAAPAPAKKAPPPAAPLKPAAKPAAPVKERPATQASKPAKETTVADVSVREVPAGGKDEAPVIKDATYAVSDKGAVKTAPAEATASTSSAQVEFLTPFVPNSQAKTVGTMSGAVNALREQRPVVALQNADEITGKSKPSSGKQPEAEPEPQPPADPLSLARDLAASKRWAEAVTAFEQYMQQQTASAEIRMEYATALLEAGDTTRAEDEFNRLLHASPDSIDAKIGLAKVLGKNQQITEAMYLLDQIFVDRKTYPKVQLARAYIYAVNDYISEAIAMIGEVQGYDPENEDAKEMLEEYTAKLDESMGWNKPGPLPDDPALRGEFQYNQGEREQSKRDFEQAVRANPGDYHSWQRLANLYRWDGQWEDAIEAYLRYLKLNPTDFDARLRYAQCLLNNNEPGPASEELWSLITDPGTPVEVYNEALLSYATALTATGQAKEALTWYEQALRFDPHNTGARAGYASALSAARHYDKAREQYRLILEEDSTSQAARIGLAQTYAWSGDLKNAIKYYDDVDQSSAYYSAALVGKAYAYMWSGRRDKAVSLAGEVARIDPANADLQGLFERLGEKPSPQLAAVWRQSHDSEDNDYTGTTTTVTVPLDSRGTTVGVAYEDIHVDNSTHNLSSSGSSTRLTFAVPLGERALVDGDVRKVDLKNNDGSTTSKWNYTAAGKVQLGDRMTVGGYVSDKTLYETAELSRNQIGVNEWAANAEFLMPDDETKLFAQYSRGKMSDHNTRDSWQGRVARSAEWNQQGRLDYGLSYRTLDYSWDVSNGYWDPDNYRIYETYLDWVDKSVRRVKLDASLGFGMQKNTNTKYNGVFRYNLGLRTGMLGDRLQLRTGYSNSNADNSATGVPGYQWKSWYISADYRF